MGKISGLAAGLLLTLALSGCVPLVAQVGLEDREPTVERDRFITQDGLRLGLQHWDAPGRPRAVIVALHGMNDYSHAFALPAQWWAAHGITTYAIDQRGFGRSPNTGIWPGGQAMRNDLTDAVAVARARYPGVPVFVLGESMGGAVAMTAYAELQTPAADGLILVSPAVWGRSAMPFTYRATAWLMAHTFRSWSLTGRGVNVRATDNDDVLRDMGRDPLIIKATRVDAVYGLVHLMGEAREAAAKMQPVHTLIVYGGKDQIIPRQAVDDVIAKLRPRGASVKFYPDGYHMILRDHAAQQRWADIANWIDQEVAARQTVVR